MSNTIAFLFMVFAWYISFTTVNIKAWMNVSDNKIAQSAVVIGFAAVYTIFVWITMKINGVGSSKDGFTFEVTPAKQCCGGPYMYGVGTEKAKMCSKVPEESMKKSCCGKGYNGTPLQFNFTPLVDDNWENPRCNGVC